MGCHQDKGGYVPHPVAIAEILRLIDLYADKRLPSFEDSIKEQLNTIKPVLVESIRGAA